MIKANVIRIKKYKKSLNYYFWLWLKCQLPDHLVVLISWPYQTSHHLSYFSIQYDRFELYLLLLFPLELVLFLMQKLMSVGQLLTISKNLHLTDFCLFFWSLYGTCRMQITGFCHLDNILIEKSKDQYFDFFLINVKYLYMHVIPQLSNATKICSM